MTDNLACDPLNLGSHDWQPFGPKWPLLLKCARPGCGIVVTKMLFDLPRAQLLLL